MKETPTTSQDPLVCTTCEKVPAGFFKRYQGFLLSPGTLITAANALLLLLGFIAWLFGQGQAASWLFLASAIIGGAPIFKLALTNIIKNFDLTAGVMVSIAMIAAILVREYSAAAIVAFMMLVGEMLENFTVAKADNALQELEQLVPEFVDMVQGDEVVTVAIQSVRTDDVVLIKPGGRIPVDGTVVKGTASVNQASITGESIPVDKEVGDSVYAGTLCMSGAIEVRVNNVGEETTLGNMIRLVKEARSSKAPVQRLANKYAQYLTPTALVIAAITYALTGDIIRGITVLIVICPCSLVLATPTALVASIGNAAKRGVLVKNGSSMEVIGKVDIVAFDKTGTLTLGQPSLKETISINGLKPDVLLGLAASVERSSEHPLARAIVLAAKQQQIDTFPADNFEALPGHGVKGTVKEHEVVIGNRMLNEEALTLKEKDALHFEQLEEEGNTVIPVAVDQEIAGFLVISDSHRPESLQAIKDLKAMGIKETVLISGDNQRVADAIGHSLGVDKVYAHTLPGEKLDIIRDYQAQGYKIAYIGDGVNDAPALAASDVGVAMGTIGTNVAMETADIVLLTDNVDRIPYLIDLSRVALKVIRNNVMFSMSWNILSVVLGAFGTIGPVVGAIMHEISALPVIANSARLTNRKSKYS